jgi:FAD/FMN-containing dehydrogenase
MGDPLTSLREGFTGRLLTDPADMAGFLTDWRGKWTGKAIKHDISLPISRIAEFIAQTDAAISAAFPGLRMVVFGHLGDGNLHYNVSPAPGPPGPPDAQAVAAFVACQAADSTISGN